MAERSRSGFSLFRGSLFLGIKGYMEIGLFLDLLIRSFFVLFVVEE